MVVGRERFTPRADARGVAIIVGVGLATLVAATGIVALVVAVLRLTGIAA